MMQQPIKLIEILSKNTVKDNSEWKHKDLYRQLYNIDLFIQAYRNIYVNQESMTKEVYDTNIDNNIIKRLEKIIENLRDESYQPTSIKKNYISKKNGKLEHLGIPSFDDKLVQECLKMILEGIYEPIFSQDSHGFRPNKSCHTALLNIKKNSNGMVWWVEGDIKGFFDNIDHNKLIDILRKKISDERFLRLIRKFLNSGYMENWKYNVTMSGTPQGNIVNPILANIYLNEFDNWVRNKSYEFYKGEFRKQNSVYIKFSKIRDNKQDMIKKREKWILDPKINEKQKAIYKKDIERIKQEIVIQDNILREMDIPCIDFMDNDYKRMMYTRYANDWVIGIIGNKQDAINLKEQAKEFLKNELKLELDEEKTLITNGKDGFKFLGFFVRKSSDKNYKINADGVRIETMKDKYQILMPSRKEYEFVLENDFARYKNGKIMPVGIKRLFTCDDLEIMEWYNAKFKGIYNYYKIADNVCKLQQARYFWKMSWGKTMANKYRSTKANIFEKYRIGSRFGIKYQTRNGENICYLFDEKIRKQQTPITWNVDDLQNWQYAKTFTSTSLMDRLKAEKCEICGKTDVPLSIHHVRKVKDLKNKKYLTDFEKLMIKRSRKQLVLCDICHSKYHEEK